MSFPVVVDKVVVAVFVEVVKVPCATLWEVDCDVVSEVVGSVVPVFGIVVLLIINVEVFWDEDELLVEASIEGLVDIIPFVVVVIVVVEVWFAKLVLLELELKMFVVEVSVRYIEESVVDWWIVVL